jgi:hypothetical protein
MQSNPGVLPGQVPKGDLVRLLLLGLVFIYVLGPAAAFGAPSQGSHLLGAGRANGFHWIVKVHSHRSGIPCLDLAVTEAAAESPAPHTSVTACLPLPGPPKVAVYVKQEGGRALSLLAGLFQANIRRVELYTRDGRSIRPTMRYLRKEAYRRVGLPRFGYIRMALPRLVCPTKIVGFNRKDQAIYTVRAVC